MAIINNINEFEWKKVHFIIKNVLLKRKIQFDKKNILPFIKEELLKSGIDASIMELAYFQIILLNTFDQLIDEGLLYVVDGIFFPVDYIIFNDYDTKYADLFYLEYSEEQQPIYFNLNTSERHKWLKKRDFLLTGGYDDESEKLLVPEVPLNDIVCLYHCFISEGAPKEEAINHILNYYDIIKLAPNDYFCNTVIIKDKNREQSFTKKRMK